MAKPIYFYGTHAILSLLNQRPMDALSLFIQQGREQDKSISNIIKTAENCGVSVQYTHKDKLSQLCQSPQHQGVVLHARPLNFTDEALLDSLTDKPNCLLLVLDQITDAHNLGACLRTAVAMGVSAVICPKHHTAKLTATVAKVSVGAMELIPVIAVTNLARSLNQLQKQGVFIFGTTLDAQAKAIYQCDLTGKVALIMGSEGEGIRHLTTKYCDELIYIPMSGNDYGNLQSLNVSVATGMVLYEANRQRLQDQ